MGFRMLIYIASVIRELLTEDTWYYLVFACQVCLAVANFTIAGCLYWIYGRNPEIRKFWGVAGVSVFPFFVLFCLKGIERVFLSMGMLDDTFWNFAAAVDIGVGFFATVCATVLLVVIRFPDGVRQLVLNRSQSPDPKEGKRTG